MTTNIKQIGSAANKNLLHKFFVAVGNSQSEIPENGEAIELRIEFIDRLHELVKEFTDKLPTLLDTFR
jgi:hypothetical protein